MRRPGVAGRGRAAHHPPMAPDRWSGGDDYEAYVGRWSRRVAVDFVDWLALPAGLDWLDLGCGTGALTATILARSEPASVLGIDPSPDFVGHAAATVGDGRARFATGDADALPAADGAVTPSCRASSSTSCRTSAPGSRSAGARRGPAAPSPLRVGLRRRHAAHPRLLGRSGGARSGGGGARRGRALPAVRAGRAARGVQHSRAAGRRGGDARRRGPLRRLRRLLAPLPQRRRARPGLLRLARPRAAGGAARAAGGAPAGRGGRHADF